jgi:hypothetical protein
MVNLDNLLTELKKDNQVSLFDTLPDDLQENVIELKNHIDYTVMLYHTQKEKNKKFWDEFFKDQDHEHEQTFRKYSESFNDSTQSFLFTQIVKSINDLYKEIGNYFNLKNIPSIYQQTLEDSKVKTDKDYHFDLNNLLQQFLNIANVNNFKSIVKDAAKNIAKDIFSSRWDKAELNKNKLKVKNFVTFDNYPLNDRELDYYFYAHKMYPLTKLLSFFEYGTLNVNWRFNYLNQKAIDRYFIKEKIEFDMDKIKSIKMFKNSNILIEFTSSIYATDFVDMFEIEITK